MKFAALLAISLAAAPAAHATHFPAPVANPVAICRAPAPTVGRTLALPGRATSCCTGAREGDVQGCAGLLSTTRIAHAPRHVRT
jgi:hypothetical protein